MVLGFNAPNGQQFPATITKVTEDKITFDLNHPLAGKKLNFKIKLIKIN
jgi:FKBP-type peptidyl-prolyl cis-trans isomerase 2